MAASREAELLQAVLDDPVPTERRKEYADCLDGIGNPRGEFIRMQIELFMADAMHQFPPKWATWHQRSNELEKQYGQEWSQPVRAMVEYLGFERGFVEYAKLDTRKFLEQAEAMFRAAPILHVWLLNSRGLGPQLFASPHLGRMRYLSLVGQKIGDAEVAALVESPHVSEVRHLDLMANDITRKGLELLCAAKNMPHLQYVRITGNRFPNPCDEPSLIDNHRILEWQADDIQMEMEARFGKQRWMHYYAPEDWFFPPSHTATMMFD